MDDVERLQHSGERSGELDRDQGEPPRSGPALVVVRLGCVPALLVENAVVQVALTALVE